MKNNTRKLYTAMLLAFATTYEVESTTAQFNVSVPMETTINDAIQESSAFLSMITVMPVTDTTGQALEIGVSDLLAKRTDTNNNDRTPTNMSDPTGTTWTVKKTEFDVAFGYQLIDQWARYPNFTERYRAAVFNKIALDRITIGFYGQSAATETDPTTNTLGQDVNIGWFKLLEDNNAENFITQSSETADEITIGEAGDYKNLDALVFDVYSAIPVEQRTGSEVVIVGSALVAKDQNKVLSTHGNTPSEKKDAMMMMNSYGGLVAYQVPKFPDKGVMVTDPKNLHLYYQESATRRKTEDNTKRDRVEDYISSNDAYAIGNVKAIAAIKAENVKFV
jgi:P2 family phage major capsid protein